MRRGVPFAVWLTVAAVPAATAQPLLSLDEAIAEALRQNRNLAAAHTVTGEADAQVQVMRAATRPRVTVAEAWQRGNQPVFVFSSLLAARRFAADNFAIDALNHPDSVGYFRTAITADQLLFDGGRTRASVRSAELQRDLARVGADLEAAGLPLAVTQAYGRMLGAAAAGRAAEAAVAAADDDLARARQRRDAGLLTEADVLGLAVHLSDLRQRAIQAQGDQAAARAELNRLLGAPIERSFTIAQPPAAGDEVPADLPLLFAEAERNRPELRRAAIAADLGDTARQQARAAFVPQVAAQAAFEVNGLRPVDRVTSWIVGGELRWSLSTGGAELARLKAAREVSARARIEGDDARARVRVDVVTAVEQLRAARARADVGREAVAQATESQRIIRDRFDAGLATVTDVLRASSALLEAEARRTSAAVDVMIGRAGLDKALGRQPVHTP